MLFDNLKSSFVKQKNTKNLYIYAHKTFTSPYDLTYNDIINNMNEQYVNKKIFINSNGKLNSINPVFNGVYIVKSNNGQLYIERDPQLNNIRYKSNKIFVFVRSDDDSKTFDLYGIDKSKSKKGVLMIGNTLKNRNMYTNIEGKKVKKTKPKSDQLFFKVIDKLLFEDNDSLHETNTSNVSSYSIDNDIITMPPFNDNTEADVNEQSEDNSNEDSFNSQDNIETEINENSIISDQDNTSNINKDIVSLYTHSHVCNETKYATINGGKKTQKSIFYDDKVKYPTTLYNKLYNNNIENSLVTFKITTRSIPHDNNDINNCVYDVVNFMGIIIINADNEYSLKISDNSIDKYVYNGNKNTTKWGNIEDIKGLTVDDGLLAIKLHKSRPGYWQIRIDMVIMLNNIPIIPCEIESVQCSEDIGCVIDVLTSNQFTTNDILYIFGSDSQNRLSGLMLSGINNTPTGNVVNLPRVTISYDSIEELDNNFDPNQMTSKISEFNDRFNNYIESSENYMDKLIRLQNEIDFVNVRVVLTVKETIERRGEFETIQVTIAEINMVLNSNGLSRLSNNVDIINM